MRDWTAQAANIVVDTVDAVRDHTLLPAQRALRFLVFGIIAAVVGLALGTLALIGSIRALSVVFEGDVWAAHAILGGIFLLAGWLCWARSRP